MMASKLPLFMINYEEQHGKLRKTSLARSYNFIAVIIDFGTNPEFSSTPA